MIRLYGSALSLLLAGSFFFSPFAGRVRGGVTINGAEEIQFYTLQNEEGKFLLRKEQTPITQPFLYLEFLSEDLDFLRIQCYGADGSQKYEAYFDTAEHTVYVVEE